VVSDGRAEGTQVIALGWDRGTERGLWWRRAGANWERHVLPAGFHGIPNMAAGGQRGIVAVENEREGLLTTPVIWRLRGSTWEKEVVRALPQASQPSPQECGAPPNDIVKLVNVEGALTAACFGDQPLTFRAWTVGCYGCSAPPSAGPGSGQPAWLAQPPKATTLFLSPSRVGLWGAIEAVLDPSLRGSVIPGPIRQVRVTGHFDDPAAQSCRRVPTEFEEQSYAGVADIVAGCRATFVVTEIREIGP